MPREPPFAAANVHRSPPWRRQQAKKLIAMEAPVTVVAGRTRPFDPLTGMGFPTLTQTHDTLPRHLRLEAIIAAKRLLSFTPLIIVGDD